MKNPSQGKQSIFFMLIVVHGRKLETTSAEDYIWLNQLSNTTNLWWIDVYYIVINYMFRCLWPSSG